MKGWKKVPERENSMSNSGGKVYANGVYLHFYICVREQALYQSIFQFISQKSLVSKIKQNKNIC